jgi:hypothetical protein
MRTLKRPMFRKGGSVNEGIMHGIEDRSGYAGGGTIGGGTIQGTPMGYRTGFSTFAPIGSSPGTWTGLEGLIGQGMTEELMNNPAKLKKVAERNPWLMRLFPWLRVGGGAAAGTALGGLTDFYLRSTDTPQAYAKRKEVVRDDPWAYHETDLEIDDEGNFYTRGSVYDKEIDELQKVGEAPGFFPRGGKKKWYKEQGIDSKTGLPVDDFEVSGEAVKVEPGKTAVDAIFSGGEKRANARKKDGSLNNITNQDIANAKNAENTLDAKRKKYMQMIAPGMQKRMINDALAAASEAFGTSTGDTKQDIANAISAAAKGMGGTKDLHDKVSMLALQGEIQKDIEASKKVKPSNFEAAISSWASIKDPETGKQKYTTEEILEKASGMESKSDRFLRIYSDHGKGEAISDQQKREGNEKYWGHVSSLDKKQLKKLPDEVDGMIIFDETEDSFYLITIDEAGVKKKEFVSRG